MKRFKRIGLVLAACVCLSVSAATVLENTMIVAEAHSGRTDSSGGHRDNKNRSGLGSCREVFDADYYYNQNEDLQDHIGTDRLKLFEHFVTCGMAEGRAGCENFNVNVYREQNPDLAELYGDDLPQYYLHYMNFGCHEGRVCN